ncbi:cytosolic protein [Polycladomyces sp. WAk]|uniref:Cytosolic protein n=1 Tax=Polycladomyces zharkentensis TaxID=2807616 RepID=A0ABS2WLS0_9BACL|nr:cytosolic protein [Polycladomyces sp. WAk]MBN2910456.1 cytosolic protein [Polycladomyces sp. WAk]
MFVGRDWQTLHTTPLSQWTDEELAFQHAVFSQLAPLMNAQGVSLHHQIIAEIERRGRR